MIIANKNFDFNKHTYVMGICNVTPDSFFDGGKYDTLDNALFRVEDMIRDGASFIDIGGESTRPGCTPVSETEELERVIPVIEAVKNRFDTVISVDTYKGNVALESVKAGADIINDVYGMTDENMAKAVKESGAYYIMTNYRKELREISALEDLKRETLEDLKLLNDAEIDLNKVIYDPGIGFNKTKDGDLFTIQNLDFLKKESKLPILLGCSNKSCIDYVLNIPKDERLSGTLATTAVAYNMGCGIVRVHNVKENVRFLKMYEAISQRRA